MAFRYPNGKKYSPLAKDKKKKPLPVSAKDYANRGMSLEEDINATNEYYLEMNIAVIHKKPTPVQIVHVDYPSRSAAKITEAYFKQASTTDYNGLYQGRYIDFEAKETRNKTSFPMRNIHDHQALHMKRIIAQGGVAFLLVRFTLLEEVYFFEARHFLDWYDNSEARKSIPKSAFEENGYLVPQSYQARVDYLQIIDSHYS
ncbi:recombination protein U [Sinobaca qinghaiensis]|uniref:Holliday junction resolvase RecU n=1 Tax=Sinobaca qinghaiensis TaxID=342944 RepID=A0A419V2W6_9BACL|nr:Holliday junction resolvase RecU [Sinobaca qinghaiensis]RKD72814.1 recombination protein U [Sinobaca qinghaiensis]